MVEELFLSILNRFPQPEESAAGVAAIKAAAEELEGVQAQVAAFEAKAAGPASAMGKRAAGRGLEPA